LSSRIVRVSGVSSTTATTRSECPCSVWGTSPAPAVDFSAAGQAMKTRPSSTVTG
jgi:hypothetical protein